MTVGLHRIQVRHAQGMICEFDVGRLAISCRCIYGHPATLHRNGEAPRFLGINLNWSSQGCPTDDMLCRRPVGYVLLLRVSEAVGRHILAACPNHSLVKEVRGRSHPPEAFRNGETRHPTETSTHVNPHAHQISGDASRKRAVQPARLAPWLPGSRIWLIRKPFFATLRPFP